MVHPVIGQALSGHVPIDDDQCADCRRKGQPLEEYDYRRLCPDCIGYLEKIAMDARTDYGPGYDPDYDPDREDEDGA